MEQSKSIVIHTRKEVITIFDELKNKINIAYETLTQESFEQLLTVIRVIFYLHPMPKFLLQINQIGSIPVSIFLQNLLIKTTMVKLGITKSFRNWAINLILKFKEALPSLNTSNIKDLKFKQYDQVKQWEKDTTIPFAVQDLATAVKRRDVGLIAVLVHFLRVIILSGQYKKQISINKDEEQWRNLAQNLVEGTKILDNLKREEISVCLCYYICLKEKELCEPAISSGAIEYLVSTLNRRFISITFGKKIIQFLKYLLINLDSSYIEKIDVGLFEKALALFSSRFDKEEVIISVRDLMSIFEQKISVIDYEEKLQKLAVTYQAFAKKGGKEVPEDLTEALHIINLYLHNDRMGNMIIKYYSSLLEKILQEQFNPQIAKMVTGFISFHFKKGKLKQEAALQVVGKINEIISNAAVRQLLIDNRKQFLIDFVKNLKLILENREHFKKTSWAIGTKQLQAKLWDYSDCTNYMYEKELIELRKMLGKDDFSFQNKEIEVLKRLEEEIINKSRFSMNKLSWELFEEVKFLENLIGDNGTGIISGYVPSNQIPNVVSNYIQISNHKSMFTLLQNIQNEESEQLRKEFNLICCKLLTKLMKNKKDISSLQNVKEKMMALTSSKDQIEDLYDMVSDFFQTEEEVQEEYERRQSTLRASKALQQQLQKQIQFADRIKSTLHSFFKENIPLDIAAIKINSKEELEVVIDELGKYETEEDILMYLQVVMELAKKDTICGWVYSLLSQKLLSIYQALSARQGEGDDLVVMLIDAIVLRFLRYHLKCLFNNNYDPDSVNYYMQYVGQIDEHFQFAFTQKRIELLQLIMEYLECNMIQSHNSYEKLIKFQNRSSFIRQYIDNNRAEAIGLSYGKLLSLNFDDEVHEAFWMQHKEHIIRTLYEVTQNTPCIKFLQVYVAECEGFIFKEYQLQNIIEASLDLFLRECSNPELICGNLLTGVLKLRKIKYFSLLLHSFIEREDLTANKNVLYTIEEVSTKMISLLLYCSQNVPSESFKKFYMEQILVTLLKTLSKLYKLHFGNKMVGGQDVIQQFDKLMEISNEEAINSVCSLMRVFLLKKIQAMATCSALQSCYQFADSLPPEGQGHIAACMRIQELLSTDGSLNEQAKAFFANSSEEEQEHYDEDFQKFAQNMLEEQELRKTVQIVAEKNSQEKANVVVPAPRRYPSIELKGKKQEAEEILVQLQSKWSEAELLETLKKVFKQPEIYSIKEIALKLLDIDTVEYSNLLTNLFLSSEKLYSQDTSKLPVSLDRVQQAIIDHIPSCCPVDQTYFEVLQSNMIISSICQRKKGGLKATQILSRRVLEAVTPQQMAHYMYNLSANVASSNELKYLNGIKIYEKVNSNMDNLTGNEEDLTKVCEFIAVTAQNAMIRGHYSVSQVLSVILTEGYVMPETKLAITKALTKLTIDCHKHKQIAQKTNIIPFLAQIIKDQSSSNDLLVPTSQLLANVIDYSQTLINQVYQYLNLEELIMEILWNEVYKKQFSSLFTSCLQILMFLSKNGKSAKNIVKARFAELLLPICKLSMQNNQNEVVGIEVTILDHLTDGNQVKLDEVIDDLVAGGLLPFLLQCAPIIPKIKKSEVFLQILVRMMMTGPGMVTRCMEKQLILKILVEILKHTQTEMVIIEKWTRLLFQIFEGMKYKNIGSVLKTNIFYLAANCLKVNYFLTQTTMNLTIRLMRELNNIEDSEQLLIRHGFANFMIQILRMKNLQTQEYIALLSILKNLQEKSSMFPPHLSTKLFQIVIKNLQIHWKDHLAVQSILLLKKIKKNVQITNQFSYNIFQFFNKFLVQSSKSNSTFQYYSISREVICLVSYFINFNDDVKAMFRSQVILNLLKSWLKIFKSEAEDESAQTFRLWLYSVFSNQTYIYDVCDVNSKKLEEIQKRFEKGWKCNLFRLDGSYKQAAFRFDRKNQQLVAFKYPDGQVKPKYSLPLKNILFVYRYQSQSDFLLQESRFTRTFNPFQHDVNYKHCVTIFCLIEEKFEVREVSVELGGEEETEEVYTDLKIILNKMIERQREEEVKYWIARSSQQIPITD